MRIGIDYTPAVRQRAGIGRFTHDLIGALIDADTTNQYVLVTLGEPVAETFGPHVRVVRLPISERAALIGWHRFRLPVAFDRFVGRLDLFHGTNFLLPPLRCPGVVTVHDLTFLRYPEFADPALAAFLAREVPRSVGRAAAVCADSQATKDDLAAMMGTPEDKIAVVTGAAAPRFRPISDPTLADRYPIDRPYLFAVGTREPRKNLAGLLDAYAILREGGLAPRLLVAGPAGWREEGFASKLAASPYRDDVLSLGFVPDADLPALLTQAACFVYPSFYEGFGLPVLEALSCGAPVVCGDTSSLPEVAGDAALLVPPADPAAIAAAIRRILTDDALAARLRAAGPAQAARFSWRSAADRLLGVYRSVAS